MVNEHPPDHSDAEMFLHWFESNKYNQIKELGVNQSNSVAQGQNPTAIF